MKWLVISYFANINGLACSHHIDDRLHILREKEVEVTLLSALFVDTNREVRHLKVPSISGGGLRFEIRQFLRKKKRPRWLSKLLETLAMLPVFPLYLAEKALFNIDTTWLWFPLAFVRGYLHCRLHGVDVIYSTGGPISAHLTAGFLSRATGIKWLAEFQDPLIHSYCARSKFELRLTHWAERYICKHASSVVFLTDQARRVAQGRTELAERGAVIYPGAPPEMTGGRQMQHQPRQRLQFIHFGSLAGSRNLGCFLKALSAIFEDAPELSGSVRVTLYGNLSAEVMAETREFPYPDIIEIAGFVPREESVAVMKQSDMLLLVQNIDDVSKETIPSKVYEYLHTGRPVFGLIYRNPELRKMLEDLGHLSVEADDVEEIAKGIRFVLDDWCGGRMAVRPKASPFTVDAAVEKLLSLSHDVRSTPELTEATLLNRR